MNVTARSTSKASLLIKILLLILAGSMVFVAKSSLDASQKNRKVAAVDQVWLPDLKAVQLLSGGHERFLADMFWLGFVQYSGDPEVQRLGKFQHAYDYAHLITRLDPHFSQPYWFGCWTIGYWQKRPDLADEILRYGIQHNPLEWYLPYLAGVNQYLWVHNDERAAAYYEEAAGRPGAPPFLAKQAKILRTGLPSMVQTMNFLEESMKNAKDEKARAAWKKRIDVHSANVEPLKRIATLQDLLRNAQNEDMKQQIRQQLLEQERLIWLRVYYQTPSEFPAYRARAKEELLKLGVKVKD